MTTLSEKIIDGKSGEILTGLLLIFMALFLWVLHFNVLDIRSMFGFFDREIVKPPFIGFTIICSLIAWPIGICAIYDSFAEPKSK